MDSYFLVELCFVYNFSKMEAWEKRGGAAFLGTMVMRWLVADGWSRVAGSCHAFSPTSLPERKTSSNRGGIDVAGS